MPGRSSARMEALTTDLRRKRAAYAAQLEGAVNRLVAVLSAIPEVERVIYAQGEEVVLGHSTEGAVRGAVAMASDAADFVERRPASGQWSGLARLGVGESSRGIRRRGGWRTCAVDLPRRFARTVRSARRPAPGPLRRQPRTWRPGTAAGSRAVLWGNTLNEGDQYGSQRS